MLAGFQDAKCDAIIMSPYGVGLVFFLSLACATFSGCDRALAAERPNAKGTQGSAHARQERGQAQRKPLDLSLPSGVHGPREPQNHSGDHVDPFSLNLFTEKKEQTPLRIKGRLLMDDTDSPSIDALDGAEIIIEIRTQ